MRPHRMLLADVGRVGQVGRRATFARDDVDVPQLVAAFVLRVGDPAAVGRPHGLRLPVIRMQELHRPGAHSRDLPKIGTAGQVRGHCDLSAVRRERGAVD